jgi:hypothetical protein
MKNIDNLNVNSNKNNENKQDSIQNSFNKIFLINEFASRTQTEMLKEERNTQDLKSDIESLKEINQKILNEMIKIEKIYHSFLEDSNDKSEFENIELKWKYSAIVLDRFFLILSLNYLFISFISVIMTIPNFYKGI